MKKLLLTLVGIVCSLGMWADDEVLFSLTVTNGYTTNLDSKATHDITSSEATIVGGTALVYNGKGSAAALMGTTNINLAGSSASYLKISMTGKTLAAGDIIAVSTKNTFKLSNTNSTSKVVNTDASSGEYVVTESDILVGKSDIYVWKNSGSSFTTITITRPGEETKVAAPAISVTNNQVSISTRTENATIYYTTDGTTPSATNGSVYSAPFTVTNSCPVYAVGVKSGIEDSDVSIKDIYVTHADALAVLGYNKGSLNAEQNVWTSAEGYVLTDLVEGRTIGYTNIAGSQDGFKINHTDSYSLQVPANVKITKIVVVGKSWLDGTSAIVIDNFTPESGAFYARDMGVKTIEFTPVSSLPYGAKVTLHPSGTQLGAYIEVYGTTVNLTEEVFSMKVAATSDQTTSGTDHVALTSEQATIVGGSATVGGKSGQKFIGSSSSVYYFRFSGNDLSFHVTLDQPIAVGDIISYTTTDNNELAFTAEATRSTDISTSGHTYTVKDGDEIVGSNDLYIWRASGNTTIFKDFTISRIGTIASPKLNDSGYATFSSAFGVQIKGAKVYSATLDSEAGKLVCTEIEGGKVPAGVGVILYGEDGATATASYCADAPAVEGNDLKATTLADGSLAEYEEALVLSGNTFKYYKGSEFAEGKAYLPYSTNSAKTFSIVFDDNDDTVTSIKTIESANEAVVKTMKNGKLIIVKGGKAYNAVGAEIK